MAANTVEGLDRRSAKFHLKEAGEWIKEQAGGEYVRKKIYNNDRIVDYYTGQYEVKSDSYYSHEVVTSLVMSMRWSHLHFMSIHVSKHHEPGFYRNFRFRVGKEADKIFVNRKGDKVLVYDFREQPTR